MPPKIPSRPEPIYNSWDAAEAALDGNNTALLKQGNSEPFRVTKKGIVELSSADRDQLNNLHVHRRLADTLHEKLSRLVVLHGDPTKVEEYSALRKEIDSNAETLGYWAMQQGMDVSRFLTFCANPEADGERSRSVAAWLKEVRLRTLGESVKVGQAKSKPTLAPTESSGESNLKKRKTRPKCVHNDAYTMVTWFGVEHKFALGVQSQTVKVLWEEWERTGLGIDQQTIGQKVDAERDNFKLPHVFRNNPAFGTMIKSDGDGRYRLVKPAVNPSGKTHAQACI